LSNFKIGAIFFFFEIFRRRIEKVSIEPSCNDVEEGFNAGWLFERNSSCALKKEKAKMLTTGTNRHRRVRRGIIGIFPRVEKF
jgi:hypothetical protein